MIAWNEYFPPGDPQGNHSSFPFRWQTPTAQRRDDLGLFPAHPQVPPLHRTPGVTLSTLHQKAGFSSYRALADPSPFITLEPALRTVPLPDSPTSATPNTSLRPDRPAPPIPRNFVDGLRYIVTRDDLTSSDCKAAWDWVEKVWGGGGG